VDIPDIQTSPEALAYLLTPDRRAEGPIPRERFSWIQQVHFGARDLVFGGGFYRPEQAGYNDSDDVARLAEYLAAVQTDHWTPDALRDVPDLGGEEERAEELEFVREWFPPLQQLYQQARAQGRLVVCEIL
jgi:hypothetical protein